MNKKNVEIIRVEGCDKIAIFIPSLTGGGAERIMVNLANALIQEKIKVDLVLAKVEGPYINDVANGVNIVDLDSKRVLTSLPKLVRYLRKEKPASILAAMEHANIVALWATKIARVKTRVIMTVHNSLSQIVNKSTMRGLIYLSLIRLFYPFANAVVVVSKEARKDFLKMTNLDSQNVKVIYNPVVTSEIYKKSKVLVEHPWFAPGEPPVILGVGRLSKQKDFSTLLKAFAIVRNQLKARLLIIGEGSERRNLEKLADELGCKDDVDLHGFVHNPYAYMAQATVFVLSSAWEGLPTALIESLAIGIPVISTDCPSGPREILQNGKYGILVPIGEPGQLAVSIMEVIQDKKVPTYTANAVAPFTLDASVNKYLRVLNCR